VKTLPFLGIALFTLAARAAAAPVTLADTVAETFSSQATQTTYRLSIYVPPDYSPTGRPCPVIYALDGLWHFALLWQLQRDLVYAKKMPPAIIVGLDYEGGEADTMRLRRRDFTPWKFGAAAGEVGGANNYLRFLETELLPRIESEYRIDPKERMLAGHSYGGTFTLYAFASRPGLFRRMLAASPSLDEKLVDYVAAHGRTMSGSGGIRLDVSYGAEELEADPEYHRLFQDLQRAIKASGAAWPLRLETRYALYDAQNHGSVRSITYNYGLSWLFRDDPGSDATLDYRPAQ
jgi:predicted alpha/beta superfamily hydrolase